MAQDPLDYDETPEFADKERAAPSVAAPLCRTLFLHVARKCHPDKGSSRSHWRWFTPAFDANEARDLLALVFIATQSHSVTDLDWMTPADLGLVQHATAATVREIIRMRNQLRANVSPVNT